MQNWVMEAAELDVLARLVKKSLAETQAGGVCSRGVCGMWHGIGILTGLVSVSAVATDAAQAYLFFMKTPRNTGPSSHLQ